MKILILLFISVLALPSSALNQGDRLSDDTLAKLNLSSDDTAIIDFFASWCVSCAKELPLIDAMRDELAAQNVKLRGVGCDEELAVGLEFVDKLKLQFEVIHDTDQSLIGTFDPLGMPVIYIVKQGVIEIVHLGAINHIDEVLRESVKWVLDDQ